MRGRRVFSAPIPVVPNTRVAARKRTLVQQGRSVREARAEFIGIEHLIDDEIKSIRSALER
jgi:low affinity Fe/Cu permease